MIIAMLWLTARGRGGERWMEEEGGRKKEWRTVTNNEDLVALSQDSVGRAEVQASLG